MAVVKKRDDALQLSIDNVNYALSEGRASYAEYLLRVSTRRLLHLRGQGSPTLEQYLGNDIPGSKIEGPHFMSEHWIQK